MAVELNVKWLFRRGSQTAVWRVRRFSLAAQNLPQPRLVQSRIQQAVVAVALPDDLVAQVLVEPEGAGVVGEASDLGSRVTSGGDDRFHCRDEAGADAKAFMVRGDPEVGDVVVAVFRGDETDEGAGVFGDEDVGVLGLSEA